MLKLGSVFFEKRDDDRVNFEKNFQLWTSIGLDLNKKNRNMLIINIIRFNMVELEGVEPSSKQGTHRLSTYLSFY